LDCEVAYAIFELVDVYVVIGELGLIAAGAKVAIDLVIVGVCSV
jgi:hypothetical protein